MSHQVLHILCLDQDLNIFDALAYWNSRLMRVDDSVEMGSQPLTPFSVNQEVHILCEHDPAQLGGTVKNH